MYCQLVTILVNDYAFIQNKSLQICNEGDEEEEDDDDLGNLATVI